MSKRKSSGNRTALSLVEVVVSMAIIAVLASLLFSVIQSVRSSSQRIACANKIRQISLAALNFESGKGFLPPGRWHYDLRDFLEMTNELDGWINGPGVKTPPIFIQQLQCPADRPIGTSNYFGSHGDTVDTQHMQGNGTIVSPLFYAKTAEQDPPLGVTLQQISDGTSQTSMFSEALANRPLKRERVLFLDINYRFDGSEESVETFVQFVRDAPEDRNFDESNIAGDFRGRFFAVTPGGEGAILNGFFVSAYNHALTPMQPSGLPFNVNAGVSTASSGHAGGVNVSYADGHVDFVSRAIELDVWRQIGRRNDN